MSDDIIKALLDRAAQSRSVVLSEDEVDHLEATRSLPIRARQLLAAHYARTRAFARALPHARSVCLAETTRPNVRNLISLLVLARQFNEAAETIETLGHHLEDYEHAQSVCAIQFGLGDTPGAVVAGREALRLKDAMTETLAQDGPAPATRDFDAGDPDRNIISFSLFGDNPRYLKGAITNTIVARYLYPGWRPRFYIDDSVPRATVERLLSEGAQVRKAPNLPAITYGLFWRFLVEDDEEVDIYIVRDADAVLNVRERAAVEDWLRSGRAYHVMRDFPTHCELVLAGMWGAHRGNLGHIGRRILSFAKANADRLNDSMGDQRFLREHVWPRMRHKTLTHDAWFGYGDAISFRKEFALPWPMHVGQNDFVRFKPNDPVTGRDPSGRSDP